MQLEIIHKASKKPNGKSLLFIHGMWHGAWCYKPYFLPYFSDLGYDTYALSFRNHGKSGHEKPIWRVRIKDYVADIKKAVDSIEGDPILVGHSMGGFVVQKYLENHTAPAAILLASTPPNGILSSTLKVLKKYPLTFLKANLTVNLTHIISDFDKAKSLLFSSSISNKEMKEYHDKMSNEAYLGYLDMIGFNLPKTKKIKLRKIQVIGAENDAVLSVKNVLQTAKVYNTKAIIIPNIAHDLMLDTNWEAVAITMQNWLKTL